MTFMAIITVPADTQRCPEEKAEYCFFTIIFNTILERDLTPEARPLVESIFKNKSDVQGFSNYRWIVFELNMKTGKLLKIG